MKYAMLQTAAKVTDWDYGEIKRDSREITDYGKGRKRNAGETQAKRKRVRYAASGKGAL